MVEYSALTASERAARTAKREVRVEREMERAVAADGGRVGGKNARKLLASRRQEEESKRLGSVKGKSGRKGLGVQWIVRRVVTPFGVSLEER